jgi:hypothetical protein
MKLVQSGPKPKNEIAETEYHLHEELEKLSKQIQQLIQMATSETLLKQPDCQSLLGIIGVRAESISYWLPEFLNPTNKYNAKVACRKMIALCNDKNLDLEKLKGFLIQREVLKRALRKSRS